MGWLSIGTSGGGREEVGKRERGENGQYENIMLHTD